MEQFNLVCGSGSDLSYIFMLPICIIDWRNYVMYDMCCVCMCVRFGAKKIVELLLVGKSCCGLV